MPVPTNPDVLVSISDLHKSYGTVEVLKGVDLKFEAGKIHAFLGANGAGKSTLLGCISGAVVPTKGHIFVDGEDHASFTPREALDKGIGIIYQHFQVFEGLTVAENIFLGRELKKFQCVNRAAQNEEARKLLSRLGVSIEPETMLDELSTGERKIVEIARALNVHPKLLILDEPTAALGDKEMAALHNVVRHVSHNEGLGVVYVTHLLDEIDEIADVVTVLRNGSIVWTRNKKDIKSGDLAEAIAPASVYADLASPTIHFSEDPVLELKDYCSPFTGPVSLELRAGEAIGVYGLLGSGRTDLLESLFGARPAVSGKLIRNGKELTIASPQQALGHGLSLVASDRTDQSLFGELSASENLLMPHFGGEVLPSKMRNARQEASLFSQIADKLSVHPPNPKLNARNFSGGNAQKLVLGRWLLKDSAEGQVILLDEPTQGVDIGARHQLYEILKAALSQGASVMFASSDTAEIVTLANRVLILGYGQQIALIDNPKNEGELVELAHRTASGMQAAQ